MNTLEQIVANNLTELRKEKKWTQAELAEKINYSDKSVSKWELGEALPDLKVLKQMADLYLRHTQGSANDHPSPLDLHPNGLSSTPNHGIFHNTLLQTSLAPL